MVSSYNPKTLIEIFEKKIICIFNCGYLYTFNMLKKWMKFLYVHYYILCCKNIVKMLIENDYKMFEKLSKCFFLFQYLFRRSYEMENSVENFYLHQNHCKTLESAKNNLLLSQKN